MLFSMFRVICLLSSYTSSLPVPCSCVCAPIILGNSDYIWICCHCKNHSIRVRCGKTPPRRRQGQKIQANINSRCGHNGIDGSTIGLNQEINHWSSDNGHWGCCMCKQKYRTQYEVGVSYCCCLACSVLYTISHVFCLT